MSPDLMNWGLALLHIGLKMMILFDGMASTITNYMKNVIFSKQNYNIPILVGIKATDEQGVDIIMLYLYGICLPMQAM